MSNADGRPDTGPIVVRNQLILALIHVTLNALKDPTTEDVVQLLTHVCQRLNVTHPLGEPYAAAVVVNDDDDVLCHAYHAPVFVLALTASRFHQSGSTHYCHGIPFRLA